MWFINIYREHYNLPKRVLEDLIYRLRYAILYVNNGLKVKTVLFYPTYPSKRSVLHKMLGLLGYNRTNNPTKKHDLVINWDLETFRQSDQVLEQLGTRGRVLNMNCKDISKKYIDQIHQEVFGYATRIDPTEWKGKCVKKNDINAMHDGLVIDCPVDREEPGFIYQVVVNNHIDENLVEDIRIPIIGKEIPLAYLKYKPVESRFGSYLKFNSRSKPTDIVKPDELFSAIEMLNIREFVQRIGLDYGELDILRDRDDGKIYIVDANTTPTGPSHLDKSTRKRVLHWMATCFYGQFLAAIPEGQVSGDH
jgi:hypothetical protein